MTSTTAFTTAEVPVFDMLTLADLYAFHADLCEEAHALHETMMNGQRPLISPTSDDWKIRAARIADLNETADAAYAEIQRRENETLDA